MKGEKYCSYGQHFVPKDQARLKPKPPGSPPSWICLTCREKRRMPREEIERMTHEEREERRAKNKAASNLAGERKRRDGND